MSKKIGVVLSGCGVMDGAEIHESVLTLLALDRAGAQAVCMAPNVNQAHVINHLTNEPVAGATRNVLEESARIARGDIKDIGSVKAADIDGLVFPGGYGAAKNLSDFAQKGGDARVHPDVERLIKDMARAGKPMGFICIAPAVAACALKDVKKVTLTIGTDEGTGKVLEGMGARHEKHSVREIAVDKESRIVSTPAYMLAQRISEAADGIEALVRKVLELA